MNPIRTEYIIMDHAPGVQLHGLWPGMNSVQHMLTVKALAKLIQSMATLPFSAYGSLYFADVPIDQQLKVPLGDFSIGPHCGWQYWDCTAGEARFYDQRKPNRGPWLDLSQYCSALLDVGFSRIPSANLAPKNELAYRGSVEEHLRLLEINERVIPELIESPLIRDLATPTLLHADLNKRNIFVSEDNPTLIISVIDWQSTSIEPTFVYANETPDLIPVRPPPISVLGDVEEVSPEDPDEPLETPVEKNDRERLENDIWISRQAFEIDMKAWVPQIHAARVADSTLLRPLRYCSTSWRDSATAIRQELIELSQRWTGLGLPGVCPYQPSPKELADHVDLYKQFEVMQKLKDFLKENFDTDAEGWIPPEAWDISKEIHKNTFQLWMDEAREGNDPKLTVEIAEKLWLFGREKNGNQKGKCDTIYSKPQDRACCSGWNPPYVSPSSMALATYTQQCALYIHPLISAYPTLFPRTARSFHSVGEWQQAEITHDGEANHYYTNTGRFEWTFRMERMPENKCR